jgi:type VI secretion system secreted protein VgrG
MEGDIDRPVVIGTLYNGAGQTDAQYNKAAVGAGAATGNAPMWFPGEEGGHAHAAVLSGIKSHAMQASQGGDGAFSQLVFDDTPAQARVALQHHARPHQGTAELNLGHLRHQTDNQRLATIGQGAELKTAHSTALRAGRGMLLSADRASTGGAHLESDETASQIEQSAQLASALAATAQKQNAQLPGEVQPGDLPAIKGVQRSVEVVRTVSDGAGSAGFSGGSATAYAEPYLQLSTLAGIAAVTAASAQFNAGSSTFFGASQDINFTSSANWLHSVKSGISLFTYGKASNAGKPVTETGMRLHAASGKVSSQSQDGPTRLTADKAITVASVTKSVTIGAREHVLLTAQGAGIKLSGGNIELQAPGKIEFKATMKELAGPQSSHFEGHEFPTSALNPNRLVIERRYHDDEPLVGAQYEVHFPDGSKRSGTLDGAGRARLENVPPGAAELLFGPMPGKYERVDQTPTPDHNPAPNKAHIDRLMDKYAPEKKGHA